MNSFENTLANHLDKFDNAPFLFVGSGLSRRYLGLEDWEGLLRQFASLNPKPFEYYRSTANGDLPKTATEIARDFHDVWWSSEDFEASREMYEGEAVHRESALKIEIAKHIIEVSEGAQYDETSLDELGLLEEVMIDGIITTNYDLLLEQLFPDLKVFVGQEELMFSAPQGIGEIYKIHGSATQPNSLVITEADYNKFHDRNPYLAAKLTTVFVEHPIIFLGFSLNDPNVNFILRAIASCLTNANIDRLRDRLLFVQWEPSTELPTMTFSNIVTDGYTIPITLITANSFTPVFQVLTSLKRRFPVRLLRKLKEHVYDLVKTNDPNGNLYVQDIDDDIDLNEVDVVLGVGAISAFNNSIRDVGYKSITRDKLLHDVLYDSEKLDPEKIVKDVLPKLLKGQKYVPVFKYLRSSSYLDDNGKLNDTSLDKRVIAAANKDLNHFAPPKYYREKGSGVLTNASDFIRLTELYRPGDVIMYAPLLPESSLLHDDVFSFIDSNFNMLADPKNSVEYTQFIKMICLYDYLRYKTNSDRTSKAETESAYI